MTSALPDQCAAITGIGLATPAGISANDALVACLQGQTAIRTMEGLDGLSSAPPIACGRVPVFDATSRMRHPKSAKFMNRAVQCGLVSACDAAAASGLNWNAIDGDRIALFTASGQTGLEYHTFFPALAAAWEGDRARDFRYLGSREAHLIDRYFSLRTLANGGLALLSMELGARGGASNFVHSDAGFAMALQTAHSNLAEHRCDVALVGAYDCLLTASNYLAYDEAGLLATEDSILRPFDCNSSGMVLGEGAAFFVLEREADARKRGVDFAQLTGIGLTQEYCASAMNRWAAGDLSEVFADAGIDSDECDFAVAHGMGIPDIDIWEARAWSSVISRDVPLTAFKGLTGYVGAATQAVELAFAILCMREGWAPPVAGLASSTYNATIDLVAAEPRRIRHASAAAVLISRAWAGSLASIGVRVNSGTR